MANVPKHDSLGDRMKGQYEDRTRYLLPRRTYTILRLDGRAFHTWTKGLEKPYDQGFMHAMDVAAHTVCEEVSGAKLAYVQSDEISVLITDFDKNETQAWFDGNVQKIVSVSASLATMGFNNSVRGFVARQYPTGMGNKHSNAVFDARVFTIPDPVEVENYFIWRQKDAERNSVTLLASHYASHKELEGATTAMRHDIIHANGDNWNNHPVGFRRGRVIQKNAAVGWRTDHDIPVFTKDRPYLVNQIPVMHSEGVAVTSENKVE